jgi:hypothetical protein
LESIAISAISKGKVSRNMFKDSEKLRRHAFSIDLELAGKIRAEGVRRRRNVIIAPGEADIECARRQDSRSLIVTGDSDLAFHAGAERVFLCSGRNFLRGSLIVQEELANVLSLRIEDLPLVAAVSGNDYATQIRGLGMARASKLIQSLSPPRRTLHNVIALIGRQYFIPATFMSQSILALDTFCGRETMITGDPPIFETGYIIDGLLDVNRGRPRKKIVRSSNHNFFKVPVEFNMERKVVIQSPPNPNLLHQVAQSDRREWQSRLRRTKAYIRERRRRELNQDNEQPQPQQDTNPSGKRKRSSFDRAEASL